MLGANELRLQRSATKRGKESEAILKVGIGIRATGIRVVATKTLVQEGLSPSCPVTLSGSLIVERPTMSPMGLTTRPPVVGMFP